ncbi:bacteriohemerythrin [bacterium 3DAC]|nr:bacteriohemerythrin [bacterium 3DAC]
MKKIIWSKDLETGFAVMDMQHRELVNKINKLIDVLQGVDDEFSMDELFVFLEEYVDVHFRTEEMYMDQTNYPEAEEHKRLHRWFEEKVKELHAKYLKEGRSASLVEDVEKFLIDWLADHIMGTDKKLAKFLLEKLKEYQ